MTKKPKLAPKHNVDPKAKGKAHRFVAIDRNQWRVGNEEHHRINLAHKTSLTDGTVWARRFDIYVHIGSSEDLFKYGLRRCRAPKFK